MNLITRLNKALNIQEDINGKIYQHKEYQVYDQRGFDVKALTIHDYYGNHNEKMFDMVIDEALKLAVKLMYPVLEEMDRNRPVLEGGEVKVHKSVKKIMKEFGQGGWIAFGFSEEHGGDQIPITIRGIASFIFAASNYSASAYPLLTTGAADLITSFGSQELIDTYSTAIQCFGGYGHSGKK